VGIQLNIVTRPPYPEKLIRNNVAIAPFLQLSAVPRPQKADAGKIHNTQGI